MSAGYYAFLSWCAVFSKIPASISSSHMRKSGPFADGLEENLLLEELWALLLPAHDRDVTDPTTPRTGWEASQFFSGFPAPGKPKVMKKCFKQ